MNINLSVAAGAAVAALAAIPLALQAAAPPAAPTAGAAAPAAAGGRAGAAPAAPRVLMPGEERYPELRVATYPLDSLRTGLAAYQANCQSCHGEDERGTNRGTDLTRSILLIDDTTGAQLSAYLKAPHGMQTERVSFPQLTDVQLKGVSDFLRAGNAVITGRNYPQPSILVGDAKAGEAYFRGAGRCATCHSPTGDFKGIGSRYTDYAVLQSYIVMPSRNPPAAPGAAQAPAAGRGGGAPATPATGPVTIAKNAMRATVTVRGQPPVTGQLVRLTNWEVVIADLTTGERKSFDRVDGEPRVTLTDPLQGHVQVRKTITDRNMHNLTAYLASLK